MTNNVQKVNRPVLVVAGSDPTCGAGLQVDLKTVASLGGYAMTVVTAITVQDTQSVYEVHPLPAELVAKQMRVCLEDMGAGCIKLGMLATYEIVEAVVEVLMAWPDIPVVADPVLAGTHGGTLLEDKGLSLYRERLFPLITVLTPNLPEAMILSGLQGNSVQVMEKAARRLAEYGPAVLVTGGHLEGRVVTDLLWDGFKSYRFESARVSGKGFHGTGCVLASSIANHLAQGVALVPAVESSLKFVRRAIKGSHAMGRGQRLLDLHRTTDF